MKEKNIDQEPEWLKEQAKILLHPPKESYGDEDQNDLMTLIDENENDQL